MSEINFITEERARELIESEVESNTDKDFIIDSSGFANHSIDTARIAYNIANIILEKHPSLKNLIDPEIIRAAGYMHDFGKVYGGHEYHEVGAAHLILTEGDKNLGLINGGLKSEREGVLREMASIIPPDLALYEELGGSNFPDGALYKDHIGLFIEKVEQLRRDLSKTDEPLSIEDFALPYTLNQQITLYADLTNLNGESIPIEQRLAEFEQRYSDPQSKYYNPILSGLTKVIKPRILVVGNTVESLMK
ncbi:hypothetical protein CEE44_00390 [Candidatus Woesearchaeota archaeon B3_Woes]|nr:MAG: hypothetical protein CEE44_00390 [Candidatus Woesearchaeota archaeon B3_Woes]